MIVLIDEWISQATLPDAITKAEKKLGPLPTLLRLESLNEGKSVQIMHIGDYKGVGKVCDELSMNFLPDNNLKPNRYYHEIYLNDPTRTAPKQRKILMPTG